MILAIDPGPVESAYVWIDEDCRPVTAHKVRNSDLLERLRDESFSSDDTVAIEMIAAYGMAVGADVFETCVWIGRFYEAMDTAQLPAHARQAAGRQGPPLPLSEGQGRQHRASPDGPVRAWRVEQRQGHQGQPGLVLRLRRRHLAGVRPRRVRGRHNMRLLDAFCGEGGASAGYMAAGFEVVGVDTSEARLARYPHESHHADAVEFILAHGHEFDAIHATPPCQGTAEPPSPSQTV